MSKCALSEQSCKAADCTDHGWLARVRERQQHVEASSRMRDELELTSDWLSIKGVALNELKSTRASLEHAASIGLDVAGALADVRRRIALLEAWSPQTGDVPGRKR